MSNHGDDFFVPPAERGWANPADVEHIVVDGRDVQRRRERRTPIETIAIVRDVLVGELSLAERLATDAAAHHDAADRYGRWTDATAWELRAGIHEVYAAKLARLIEILDGGAP